MKGRRQNRLRGPPRGSSSSLDLDPPYMRLRVCGLRDGDGQYALVVFRVDLFVLDGKWQTKGARKRAVAAFHIRGVAILLLVLRLLLSLDGEHVIRERYLNVLFVDAWDLRSDHQLVVALADIDCRIQTL